MVKAHYETQKAAATLFSYCISPQRRNFGETYRIISYISPFETEKKVYSTHLTETTWNPSQTFLFPFQVTISCGVGVGSFLWPSFTYSLFFLAFTYSLSHSSTKQFHPLSYALFFPPPWAKCQQILRLSAVLIVFLQNEEDNFSRLNPVQHISCFAIAPCSP